MALSSANNNNNNNNSIGTFKAEDQDPVLVLDTENKNFQEHYERSQWVLNAPDPPTLWQQLAGSVKNTVSQYKKQCSSLRGQPGHKAVLSLLSAILPILDWGRNYTATKFRKDLLAGLTIASLCIPQSIGYATLAKLDPEYGLYTSVVPPLICALMGTSREIAIGPVAVVSILLSSMIQNLIDPDSDPVGYKKLVFTATLIAGIYQSAFGIFRIILISIGGGTETLGRIPGADMFCDVHQYPMAVKTPGVVIIRIKSALLCFSNANSVRERIMNCFSVLSSAYCGYLPSNINFCQLAIANPRWQVINKLKATSFVKRIGDKVFLTIGELWTAKWIAKFDLIGQ